ncbi:MAG: ABC transporter substrate-binding protein [Desulfuromonas sp.]|nr:ABC transporter substrate-binding protein [Desulfuromonas sp.]
MKHLWWLVLVAVVMCNSAAGARQITDMAGRQVEVPQQITHVIGAVAPVSWMLYAIDRQLLAAFTSTPDEQDWQILDPAMRTLPAIGSFIGGQGVQQETLLALHPDVVVFWGDPAMPPIRRWVKKLEHWGIPAVFVSMDNLAEYPRTLRFLGELLQRQQRAEELASYGEQVLQHVSQTIAALPTTQHKRVYYAQGIDGLETEPADSFHAQLIPLAGGENVYTGTSHSKRGREKVRLEQVLSYQPEVILVEDKHFFATIYADKRWQSLPALKHRQVFLIPNHPLNWFDRPPSMMRFLGLQWLTHLLHPHYYAIDMVKQTQTFYRLFFATELSEDDVAALLRQQL